MKASTKVNVAKELQTVKELQNIHKKVSFLFKAVLISFNSEAFLAWLLKNENLSRIWQLQYH